MIEIIIPYTGSADKHEWLEKRLGCSSCVGSFTDDTNNGKTWAYRGYNNDGVSKNAIYWFKDEYESVAMEFKLRFG